MSTKLRVFLSSSQGPEFKTEREALPLVFDKHPLNIFFKLWRVEDYASPRRIDEHCKENVEHADVLLLLLGEELRPAVVNEYNDATRTKKDVFVFVKTAENPTPAVMRFVKKVLYDNHAVVEFSNLKDLVDKIEKSFLGFYQEKRKTNPDPSAILVDVKADRTERALRLFVGILNSPRAKITKQKVFEAIVQQFILDSNSGADESELKRLVAEFLEVPVGKIRDAIEEALENLKQTKKLNETDGGVLVLGNEEQAKLTKLRKKSVQEEQAFLQRCYEERPKSLQSDSFSYYCDVLVNIVTRVVFESAVATADIPIRGDLNPFAYDAATLKKMIVNALLDIKDLRGEVSAWSNAILDVLVSDNPQTVLWLKNRRKSYWLVAAAGKDPDVIDIYNEKMKGYCIYIDSHVAIRAVSNAGDKANLCRDIIELCGQVGVEVRMTSDIFSEVRRAFEVANESYVNAGRDVPRAVRFLTKIERKTDILDGFLLEKKDNEDLTWANFIGRYFSPMNDEALIDFLRNELGIHVDNVIDYTQERFGRIEEIRQLLMNIRGYPWKAPSDGIKQGGTEKWDAINKLRVNEARQMELVYYQRRSGQNTRQFWFVTFDTFVYEAAVKLYKTNDEYFGFPCFLKPGRLLAMLEDATTKRTELNSFREILLSPIVKNSADNVESQVINEMLKARIDKTVKSVNTLQNMFEEVVNRPAVQDAMEGIKKAKTTIEIERANQGTKDAIIDSLKDAVNTLQADIEAQKEIVDELRRGVEKAQKKTKYFKGQLTRAKGGKKKKKLTRGKRGKKT
jgi:hypothetical protein